MDPSDDDLMVRLSTESDPRYADVMVRAYIRIKQAEARASQPLTLDVDRGTWRAWIESVRIKFRLDKATGTKDYWDGYRAAIDDVERHVG